MKSLICCLALTLASHAAETPPSWAGKLKGAGEVRVAVTPPEGNRFAHLSWPKAVRTKDGTIVLAYIAGTFHGNGGGGSPAISVSKDHGKSFSPPKILQEFGPGKEYTQSGNLALGVAADGALVLLAMAFTGDEGNSIFGWRSTDQGESWTATDTSALGPNKTGSVFGNILPVSGQGLVVLGHYRQGSQPHTKGIWMATSSDQGLVWNTPVPISDVSAVEPVLVRTSGGRLLVISRGTARAGQEYVSVSDDAGKTWTTSLSPLAAESGAKYSLAAPFATENPEIPNELLALTTERAKGGEGDDFPSRIWLWRADAGQLDWKRERVLIEFPRGKGLPNDLGYPWLLHVEGGRWLMYYYHGVGHGVNYIWVAEVEI